jgi:anhydro-N-acetylmuramic acid kinase
MLAATAGLKYDDGGKLAATGNVNEQLLHELNSLEYYSKAYPKSLANSFGVEIVYPMIMNTGVSTNDALRTYTEHIAVQIKNELNDDAQQLTEGRKKILVTGGGSFNSFLIERLTALLAGLNIDVIVPAEKTVQYKEAVIMALIGVLRWREEANVLPSVTGASRESVGGALWIG